MQAILTKVLEIAPSDARVVILGETATGKGLLARTILALSRHAKPFVDVYCGALATSLLESGIGLPQRRPPAAKNTREGRGDFAFLRKFWAGLPDLGLAVHHSHWIPA
jgi:transcriptional regulator with GAF, ATPase, and Fis domain